MIIIAAIAAALLAAAPAAAPPAASDEEVWALARKVNAAPAYQSYLDRFPQGAHRVEAVDAFYGVQGLPVLRAPPPPPGFVTPPVVTVVPPSGPDPCVDLLTAQAIGRIDSEEARAYLAARRGNRLADFRAYLGRFPGGACAADMATTIRNREKQAGRLKRIAGFGPLAAQRLVRRIVTEDDYPVSALRNGEAGRVVAEWEASEDGFAEGCRIVQSSGFASLDETTCRLIAMRMRYDPARDSTGAPARSADTLTLNWVLPPD
jgi:TonB family protein